MKQFYMDGREHVTRSLYDWDGKRAGETINGVTTVYIGDYFEWTGSASTLKPYNSIVERRIAMRVAGGSLTWLFAPSWAAR